MDYSKLSDQEINKNVAFALGCKEVVPGIFMSDDRRYEFEKPKNKGGYQFYFDPCNNPADAWPIIVSNLISIEPDYEFIDPSEEQVFASGAWIAEHCDGKGTLLQSVDINPLRAAMIVFLMMQDSANVPTNSTGSDLR